MINKELAVQRGLSEQTISDIEHHHDVRDFLVGEMKETPREELRELFKDWVENEYMLQNLWGFPESSAYHKWWSLPQCTCPKMDNEDAYPVGYYVMNDSCPMHGQV